MERFAMRQINRDELAHILRVRMRVRSRALLNDLQHHDPERRLLARLIAAGLLADKLRRLEKLTDAPEAAGFRYVHEIDAV